jgi:carnitine-CoA ligase
MTAATRDTLVDALRRAVTCGPSGRDAGGSAGAIFLDFSGTTYSYGEFDALSTALAIGLSRSGVAAGDRVATMMDNSVDMLACLFATVKLGAIWVPVNTALRGEFLRHPLADSGASVLVCDAAYLDRVTPLGPVLPELRLVLVRGGTGQERIGEVEVAPLDSRRGTLDTDTGDTDARDPFADVVVVRPSDTAALMYTSGTTGPSKACVMSHNYLCHIAACGSALVDLQPGEVVWTPLPLFHSSGLQAVTGALLTGGRASIAVKFSVSSFWQQIEASGARVAKIMASMVPLLAQAPDDEAMKRCHGQLRAVVGNPFSPAHRQVFRERFGVKYIAANQYASTEGYCITSVPYGTDAPPGSAGRRNDDYDIILVDDDGTEVGTGVPGEILFRPRRPGIMFGGYWRQPEKTAEAWRDLWMHTGDLARFDADGYLYFVERKKDYIRRRGENISSWEVEQTVLGHPAVKEVAVHAVPSELGEDDIKVVAVLDAAHDGPPVSARELWQWSVARLPAFAVPRYVEFRDNLPKNGVGRVLKFQLRDEGVTGDSWDVEETDLATRAGGSLRKF